MGKKLGLSALVGTLLSVLVVPAVSAVPVMAAEGPDWHRCAPDRPANFECATVRVPLDYQQPGGRQIDIAISRVKAGDPGARRGVLLMNPGGPGGSGLDLPVSGLTPKEVSDRYDLIGFDPRGVGASTPVGCGLGEGGGWSPIPFDNAKFADAVAQTKEIAEKCWANQPDLLPYITTRNTARDMDVIRAALGEPKISYFGISYGTYLGAVYTQLFPERSDRILLDSSVDPERAWRGMVQIWSLPAERAFDLFADWAAERDATYHLGDTAARVSSGFRRLLNQLDKEPVVVDGRSYDGNTVRRSALGAGQHEENSKALAELLRKLLDAPGAGAARTEAAPPAEPLFPARPARWQSPPPDNSAAAFLAVVCGDARWPTDVEQYRRDALRDTRRFPLMGGQTSNIAPCAFWPDPKEPRTQIRDNRAESVLLVQNSHDTQTPIEGARNLRELLPDNSRMALVEGSWRHGAYPGNCADATVTRYLLSGELPAKDVTCPSTGDR
ncbi:alpha/beta hydrolase [Amycolatopsis nigrescens]|uniref:alpha/beta hydrolase n=1 Tax=Amycolatopsis nigrescens TaxID=381445 RepID=UPI00037AE439|nr:alpha/beta hydrolase [Amycolatopsis nigrescens]